MGARCWQDDAGVWLGNHGARWGGSGWADTAVETVAARCRTWGVSPVRVLGGGTQSLVVAGERAGAQVVVKYVHDGAWLAAEVAALRAWPAGVAPRVVDAVGDAALLSWVPGVVPEAGSDGLVVAVARRVAAAAVEAPVGVRSLGDRLAQSRAWFAAGAVWADQGRAEGFSAGLEVLEGLVAGYRAGCRECVVVHTDLAAKNLLVADGVVRWVDPMACAGPVEFDVAYACWALGCRDADPRGVAEVAARGAGLDAAVVVGWVEALAVLWAFTVSPPAWAGVLAGI